MDTLPKSLNNKNTFLHMILTKNSSRMQVKRDTAFAQILATMSSEFVEGKKKKRKSREVTESAWPPKMRRRLRYKQGQGFPVFSAPNKK